MNKANTLIITLLMLPAAAQSTTLRNLSEHDQASYCSGVFVEFIKQSALPIADDNHQREESRPAYYNLNAIAKNLQLRAALLFDYGQNKKMQKIGVRNTARSAELARMAGITNILDMDSGIQPCFEFYWDHQDKIETGATHLIAYKSLH